MGQQVPSPPLLGCTAQHIQIRWQAETAVHMPLPHSPAPLAACTCRCHTALLLLLRAPGIGLCATRHVCLCRREQQRGRPVHGSGRTLQPRGRPAAQPHACAQAACIAYKFHVPSCRACTRACTHGSFHVSF
eukprot:366090-Chlamydomonas_euryale.AAC.7